jgi:serine/threonine-protein kinase
MVDPRPSQAISGALVLVEKLAAGGMGQVWIARHATLDTEVAVKLLGGFAITEGPLRERFEREAKALARVKSPHVVTVLDAGVSDELGPFIVMELLEGEDLEARLGREEVLSAEVTLALFEQIGHALALAHEAGLVHRDIKPSNVFLVRNAPGATFAKLLDFGIARDLESPLTEMPARIGTPLYMSPEQAEGREVSHATDVYALGMLAYRCLVGATARTSDSLRALGAAAYRLTLPTPSAMRPNLPSSFDRWFQRSCAWEVDSRYADVDEQIAALRDALTPTHEADARAKLENARTERLAPRPEPAESTEPAGASRPIPNRPALPWWGALAAVVLVLMGGYVYHAYASGAPASARPSSAATASADAQRTREASLAPTPSADGLRLPLLLPLTGAYQRRGQAMRQAAELAVALVNEAGGVRGKPITLDVFDDGGDEGPRLRERFRAMQPARVLLGPMLSAQGLALQDELRVGGPVLAISASMTSDTLAPDLWVLLATGDRAQASALRALMSDQRCGKAAIVAAEGGYTARFADLYLANDPVARRVDVPAAPKRSYDDTARAVEAGGTSCVVLALPPPLAARYMQYASTRGVRYFASDLLATRDFIELGRDDRALREGPTLAEGVMGVRPKSAADTRREWRFFERRYEQKSGSKPTEPFVAEQFDAVVLAALAFEAEGLEASPLSIRGAIARMTQPGGAAYSAAEMSELLLAVRRPIAIDYEGASGDITFDGGRRRGALERWRIQHGKVEALP